MSTVYVRWYGKVLEGELIDGEPMGMKQVRIPLDGHHPIALFTSGHVYQTEAEAFEGHKEFVPDEAKKKKFEVKVDQISGNSPIISLNDPIKTFKHDNWDHERNHLRTDKLDEFYQLWRKVMVPHGYVVAEAPKRIVSDEQMEDLKEKLKAALDKQPAPQPTQMPVSPKPSKKMLRSTGQQKFNDSIQLSIFD